LGLKSGLLRRTIAALPTEFKENPMLANQEHLSKVAKTSIDAQLKSMHELANQALHSVTELVELNIATAKESLSQTSAAAAQMLAAKDAQALIDATSAQAQPGAEKALAYARHMASIMAKAQAEFTSATETRIGQSTRQINQLIDEMSKSAPAGSENVITLLKASVANTNAAIEQMVKGSKQALATMESGFEEISNQMSAAKPSRAKK
jgi:phasin family protein